MRWYADNSEVTGLRETGIPDILMFGGVIVASDAEMALRNAVEAIKAEVIGEARAPIKWNFKDLKSLYEKQGMAPLYKEIMENSKDIRRKIFETASKQDFRIIVSCLQSHSAKREILKAKKQELSGFVFSNGLMRMGLYVREARPPWAQVVLDWPDRADPQPFDKEYASAFSYGKTRDRRNSYFCGCLKDLAFVDSVTYSNMHHSTLLQFSDLVLGATRDLVECALGKRIEGLGLDLLPLIKNHFDGAPSNIVGRGINLAGDDTFKRRITTFLRQQMSQPTT